MKLKYREKMFSIKNIPNSWKKNLNVEELKIFEEQYKSLKHKRGECIDKGIDIENRLDDIISCFLFGSDQDKKDIFRELILGAEFFTFIQKKKAVEKIIKQNSSIFPNLTKETGLQVIQTLHNIINDRNKMAHGNIYLDYKDKRALIAYYEEGNKEIELNSKFFGDFDRRIEFLHNELDNLLKQLKKI